MYLSEKPSGCDIEQAGVAVLDGRGQGSRVTLRLLWIGIISICVACNLAMFLWIKNLEKIVNVNAQNYQKLLDMQSTSYIKTKYDDESDDNEDYPLRDNVVVRALRDGTAKAKGRKGGKNRNRHRKGKKRCPCSDLLKKLKSKRDVSGQSNILTYMKGLAYSEFENSPFNNEGIFLWQKPDRQLGNYFQYTYKSPERKIIKAIKIGIVGIYELKTQVTLGGSTLSVDNPECGVKLVKSRGGIETELARSVLTQTIPSGYGQSHNRHVLDNVKVGGIFHLNAGDEVFVRKCCNHARFIVNDELSSFSAVLWNES